MPRNQLTQAARLTVCLLACCCALTACNKSDSADKAESSAFAVHQYAVRAEIVSLPAPGDAKPELIARHEMIPDFRGQGGHRGMKAMTMPFPVADGLALDAFSPGDKITLTFTVDFDEQGDTLLDYRATQLEPLPDDTELVFLRLDEYTVRARVTSLPDPDNPMSEFAAHHEYIPDFKGPGGELGMNVMVMAFPLAESFSLDGLSPGDIIELTFTVDFDIKQNRPAAYRATRWSPLPADTQLALTPNNSAHE